MSMEQKLTGVGVVVLGVVGLILFQQSRAQEHSVEQPGPTMTVGVAGLSGTSAGSELPLGGEHGQLERAEAAPQAESGISPQAEQAFGLTAPTGSEDSCDCGDLYSNEPFSPPEGELWPEAQPALSAAQLEGAASPTERAQIIQAALDSPGRKLVRLPAGSFEVGSLTLPSDTALVGAGMDRTTLIQAAGRHALLRTAVTFEAREGGSAAHNVVVADLSLDAGAWSTWNPDPQGGVAQGWGRASQPIGGLGLLSNELERMSCAPGSIGDGGDLPNLFPLLQGLASESYGKSLALDDRVQASLVSETLPQPCAQHDYTQPGHVWRVRVISPDAMARFDDFLLSSGVGPGAQAMVTLEHAHPESKAHGIEILGGRNVIVRGVSVSGFHMSGVYIGGSDAGRTDDSGERRGICCLRSENVFVEDSVIIGNQRAGLDVVDAINVTLSGNRLEENNLGDSDQAPGIGIAMPAIFRSGAITIEPNPGDEIVNVLVYANDLRDNHANGVHLTRSDREHFESVVIAANRIEGSARMGIAAQANAAPGDHEGIRGLSVFGNTIVSSGGAGVGIGGIFAAIVTRNQVIDSGQDPASSWNAFVVNGGARIVTLAGNEIQSGTNYGLTVDGTAGQPAPSDVILSTGNTAAGHRSYDYSYDGALRDTIVWDNEGRQRFVP